MFESYILAINVAAVREGGLSGWSFNLIKTKTVANDDFLRLDSADIILESGDIIKAQASAADDLEVSAFIEEYPDPMR